MSDDQKKSRNDIERDLKDFKNYEDATRRTRDKLQQLYEEDHWESQQPIEDFSNMPTFHSLYEIHGPGYYLDRHTKKKYTVHRFSKNVYRFESEDKTTWGSFDGKSKQWEKA